MSHPPEFRAPWPFSSPHLQTLGAALPLHVRPPADARDEPLRFEIPGGGRLHAFGWWHPGRRPAVLLVHGVGGSVSSRYMVRAAKALYAAGYQVVRLNVRGAGESLTDAPQLYHAGLIEDLQLAADALRERPEISRLAVMGFSLGGNCALRFAAAEGTSRSRADAVVTISAPVDLASVSRLINRPLNLPYRSYILRGLVKQGLEFAQVHPERAGYDLRELRRIRTIWAYDDLVVAPMHGFGTAANYYAQVSAGPAIPEIRLPTLMIHAEDDPIVPGATVRPFADLRGASVELAWSRHGGHVGWFSGLGEAAWLRTWAVEHALAFLRAQGLTPA